MGKKFVCIAGKNNIAIKVLEYIFQKENRDYELGIVCNRTETGVDGWQRSYRKFANGLGIKEYKLEDLYDIENLVFVSLEFDQIVKPQKFKNARLYNIHFSLLPAYKGMYTSVIPLLNGERKTGVTFHCIDAGIDTGDIIAQKEFVIEKNYTARDVYFSYIKYGTELVIKYIDDVINNNVETRKQPAEGSTYYSKRTIDYSNIKINLQQTAENIYNQLRAFNFREYQIPTVYEKPIIASEILQETTRMKPGTILQTSDVGMTIATIDYDMILYYDRFEELMQACEQGDLELVKEICKVPRHINDKNDKGWTPLIVATYNGHMDIVKYLLSAGADIYDTNYNGTNLLMYAKEPFLRTGNSEMFKLIWNLGISPEIQDFYGKSLIDYLAQDGYTVSDLLKQ